MKKQDPARNVDTIRNILQDELVRLYSDELHVHQEIWPLLHLLERQHPIWRVGERLGITMPDPGKVALLTMTRAYRDRS